MAETDGNVTVITSTTETTVITRTVKQLKVGEPVHPASELEPGQQPTVEEHVQLASELEPRQQPTVGEPVQLASELEPVQLASELEPRQQPTVGKPMQPASELEPGQLQPTVAKPMQPASELEQEQDGPEPARQQPSASACEPVTAAERMRVMSTLEPRKEKPDIYQVPYTSVYENEHSRLRVVEICKKFTGDKKPSKKAKVIMTVGATGSGKTTTLNMLFNFMLGVRWEDSFRFRLICEDSPKEVAGDQTRSQTSWVTAYVIHWQPGFAVNYNLVVVDTPGYGDTRGIDRDMQITKQIGQFFSDPNITHTDQDITHTDQDITKIDHLDAILFVVNSTLPRLTDVQRYIFDSVLALFGKNMKKNISVLVTFADANVPPAKAAIKAAKVPYSKMFKFNNSALFANNSPKDDDEINSDSDDNTPEDDNEDDEVNSDSDDDIPEDDDDDDDKVNSDSDDDTSEGGINKQYWKIGMKSFERFSNHLKSVKPKSLKQTRKVFTEREQIELRVERISKHVQEGINMCETIRQEIDVVQKHENEIEASKNFTYTVTQSKIVEQKLARGIHVTNCLICNNTCHYQCGIPNDDGKRGCVAMDSNGYCHECTGKCHWSQHRNMPYRLVISQETVTKNSEELRKKYETAQGKALTHRELLDAQIEDFKRVQLEVLENSNEVRLGLSRLKDIALKSAPLTHVDYIEKLIRAEERAARPGYKERVEQLDLILQQAKQLEIMSKDNYDPFKEHCEALAQRAKQSSSATSNPTTLEKMASKVAMSTKWLLGLK